jgi:hypothetical protein
MPESENTLIQVKKATADKLKELGKMDDTYETVITMLIEAFGKRR